MSIQPGCIPCLIKQGYSFAKLAGISDPEIQNQILFETMAKLISNLNIKTAPHFSIILQSVIDKYVDINKVFKEIKKRNIQLVMKHINYLDRMIKNAGDKMETAISISIAGNSIDLAANPDFDIEKEIDIILSGSINLGFLSNFKKDYQRAEKILIIGDNYEEAVFDKFLIKQLLPKEVIFAVRSKEILNDITREDALGLGIDKLCMIVETGNIIAGIDLEECSNEFLDIYYSADLVIAKGQGNFETLFDAKRPVYFLFKVKCDVIAEISGYPIGTGMLYYHNGIKN
jgi:damage-control phosphatase, subfamily I